MDEFWPLLGIWKELFHSLFVLYMALCVVNPLSLSYIYGIETRFFRGPNQTICVASVALNM